MWNLCFFSWTNQRMSRLYFGKGLKVQEQKGPLAVLDGGGHHENKKLAHGKYHVNGRLHPKIKTFGPSGECSTIFLFMIRKQADGVTLEKMGCIWGSTRTLIAAERCLFAPNMFVNVGLTNLKKNMFSAGFKSSAMF